MKNHGHEYKKLEWALIEKIILYPEFVTKTMHERINEHFVLLDPTHNRNDHSNYDYAEHFFQWILSGEKQISGELLRINPWVKRFVDTSGLPEGFSSSYAYKIRSQLGTILGELKNQDSRRAYINILVPDDQVILGVKTTHEFPCTIGLHFMIREERLHLIVNMRSNNVYSVMPYDVYNFTRLQQHVADLMKVPLGYYHHQINSAHLYNGDARRIKQNLIY